jgi:transposase
VYASSTVTDAQWRVLSVLLPPPGNTRGRGGRPETHDRRRIVDAIFYLVRGGLAWRALPAEFPPWQSVYGWFVRWRRDGTWQSIHDMLRDRIRVAQGRSPLPTAAIIDSQSVKGADTVARTSRGYDAGKRSTAVNGTSRWTAATCC